MRGSSASEKLMIVLPYFTDSRMNRDDNGGRVANLDGTCVRATTIVTRRVEQDAADTALC